jgi:hypothetical protein
MIRRLIGAAIGASVAKRHPAAGGITGAVLASAVPFVLTRISLPAMVVMGVGGYAAKRFMDRREPQQNPALPPPTAPVQP